MQVLFISPYPLGQAPSQRFRFEQYFEVLSARGVTYSCHSFWDSKTWGILYKPGYSFLKIRGLLKGFMKSLWVLLSIPKYKFIFIHRECTPVGPPILEWIIARVFRKEIIYDFDDAIWLPNTSHENRIASFIKCHWKVISICRLSYKVSCGNEYLTAFAKRLSPKDVITNPTTIDTENLHNPSRFVVSKPNNTITIGWTGTHSTLKYLDSIVPVIQQLEAQYNTLRFVVIADKKPDIPLRSIHFIQWSKAQEMTDLLQIDIGIMPLTDDIWAQGKCGFKALQYMALGIPTLASPVGVNSKIIDHTHDGFLCATDDDWFTHLNFLINDKEARKKMGEKARRKVIDQYSVLSNTSNFLSLFE